MFANLTGYEPNEEKAVAQAIVIPFRAALFLLLLCAFFSFLLSPFVFFFSRRALFFLQSMYTQRDI